MGTHGLQPSPRERVLNAVCFPHLARPASNEIGIFALIANCFGVRYRHDAARREHGWLLEGGRAVQPTGNRPIQPLIVAAFETAIQAGQMRRIRLRRTAVLLGMLHGVGVDDEIVDGAPPGAGPRLRAEAIENILAAGAPAE